MSRESAIYKATAIGSAGNLALVLFKLAAGIAGQSAAMLADALHSLSDFITDILVVVFVRISGKAADEDHDYGHGKYETLATAIIGLMLLAVGIGLLAEGCRTVWNFAHGEPLAVPGTIALVAALVSIAVKEALYQYTVRVGRRVESAACIANAWHHRSDALSSIGTAIGIGGAIALGDKWAVLDPIAAIVVSIMILRVAWQLMAACFGELLEQSLPGDVEKEINDILLSFPEAAQPHNLRTRRIGHTAAMDVHVRMDGAMTVDASHAITRAMEKRLRELLGTGAFISIHVEPKKKS